MNLFLYGTLMDDEIFTLITGSSLSEAGARPAILHGHRVTGIAGLTYPMLTEETDGKVRGLITGPLDDEQFRRIQFYEGGEYALVPVTVETDTGNQSANIFGGSAKAVSDGLPWTLDRWQRADKAITVEIATEMMPLFSSIPYEEFDALWDEKEAVLLAAR